MLDGEDIYTVSYESRDNHGPLIRTIKVVGVSSDDALRQAKYLHEGTAVYSAIKVTEV